MNKIFKIGFPMEYEDDKHIIRTGLWLKEYEVEMLEKKLNEYNNLQSKIDKAIEYIESMKYCGQEDYFYDNKSEDPCGNDNTFDDSKNKLLDILKEDK